MPDRDLYLLPYRFYFAVMVTIDDLVEVAV